MARLTVLWLAVVVVFLLSPLPSSAAEPDQGQLLATGSWITVTAPTPASMYGLDMISATEGWAAGMTGFVWHVLNGTWGGVPTTFSSNINAIDMLSASSGWGVTWQGHFLRCNGNCTLTESWSVHSKQGEILDDIYMLSETDGWAVGGGGVILRYNGSSWNQVTSPALRQLKGVDMLNAGYGWAVGLGGWAVQWNGSAWAGGVVNAQVHFTDVDVLSASDVWAVGMNGAIYHYNGAGWSAAASPTANNLAAVFMVSASNGWAVGEGGVIIHYDGLSWQSVASPTTSDLNAVCFGDALNGWAVGKNGVIVRYVPAPANLTSSSKSVNLHHAQAGDILTYTIRVKNSGELAASGVSVTDYIPAGTTFAAGSITKTRGSVVGPDPIVWTVGALEAGGEATMTFQVTAQDLGQACWMVVNQATVAGGGASLTRAAGTALGDCYQVFLPIIVRSW